MCCRKEADHVIVVCCRKEADHVIVVCCRKETDHVIVVCCGKEADHVIVVCCRKEAERILSEARAMKQTGKDYIWIMCKAALGNIVGNVGDKAVAPDDFFPGLLGTCLLLWLFWRLSASLACLVIVCFFGFLGNCLLSWLAW